MTVHNLFDRVWVYCWVDIGRLRTRWEDLPLVSQTSLGSYASSGDEDGTETSRQGWTILSSMFLLPCNSILRSKCTTVHIGKNSAEQSKSSPNYNYQFSGCSLVQAKKPADTEGWEYAPLFTMKFHSKDRRMDLVRRRRWHRKMVADSTNFESGASCVFQIASKKVVHINYILLYSIW